jgi:putative two-component system response regulator
MTKQSSEQTTSRKKILIVDDSEMNRSLLSDILCDQFDIMEADNGITAAAVLQNHEQEISLMLLDIVMPEMDGFELLALMNKKGWIKSIPVITISSETVPAYIERAYNLGALEYISRPFDERTVRHRVSSSIMLTARQKELSLMVTDQMVERERDNHLMIEILSTLVEFRNGESGLHVLHVQTITELLLDSLLHRTDRYSLTAADKHLICNAAALHDIGKIVIPSEILNKPSSLTPEEFEVMKTHTVEGARILESVSHRRSEPLIQYSYQICRWHHERYDGRGYPDGLKGDDIPIAAQVVSLADVYDALTSKRVYKEAIPHPQAIRMIMDGQCGCFNPLLLECLLDIQEQLVNELHDLSLARGSQQEVLKNIDRIPLSGNLTASNRTLRLLEREKMKYQFVADISKEIVFEYTAEPEMITLSGWGSDYLALPETILHPKSSAFGEQVFDRTDFADLLHRLEHSTPEKPIVDEKYLLTIGGKKRWCRVVARSMWANDGRVVYEGAIGKIVDIHDTTETIRQLEQIAEQDSLTGLFNHGAARYQISARLQDKSTDKRYWMVLFDMDDFKAANDNYGHLFGDELLQHIAGLLRESIGPSDIASRMGGDEFMVFIEQTDPAQIERLFHHLSEEYKGFRIRLSMGIADAQDCGGDYENLFQMADTAMYAVKYGCKNGYRFYRDLLPAPAADYHKPKTPSKIKQVQPAISARQPDWSIRKEKEEERYDATRVL